MSLKRSLLPVFRHNKRVCRPPAETDTLNNTTPKESRNEVKAAILLIKAIFPKEHFEGRLPAIIMKHQIYAIINNRTEVDRQINELQAQGEVQLFKLGITEELAIVFREDYREHVKRASSNNIIAEKFITHVLDKSTDLCFDREFLCRDCSFTEEEISDLVRCGVLTVRDVGSWWLAIPGAGGFVKAFILGRKAMIQIIRRSKYKELLQDELEKRKLPRLAKLGMKYHIYDIIGADIVTCIQVSTGKLLRLND